MTSGAMMLPGMFSNLRTETFTYEITGAMAEEDLGTGGANATATTSGAEAVPSGCRRVIVWVGLWTEGTSGAGVITFRDSSSGTIIAKMRHRNSNYSELHGWYRGAEGDEITIAAPGVTGNSACLTIMTVLERIPG